MAPYNNSVGNTNYWIGMFYFVFFSLGATGVAAAFFGSNIMSGDFELNPPQEWENPVVKMQQAMEANPVGAEVFKNTLIGLVGVVGGMALLRSIFSATLYTRGRLS